MVSEDNPTITLNIDGTNRLTHCKSLTVKNTGILKIPTADITLFNKNGQYTHGADEIGLYDTVYIDADVRGVTDRLFYGKVYDPSCKISKRGTVVPAYLVLECKALYGQKLIREKITKDYADDGWRCKEAIEDFLANPDSGADTGITLETDTGDIIDTPFPINLKHDTLLRAIRTVAEELNYEGYWKGDTWDTLWFKAVGTEACSPAIHLQHPFVEPEGVQPKFSIDDIQNYILVEGSTDQGYPPEDIWIEDPLTRYDPEAWSKIHANITMSEDSSRKKLGDNSLKLVRNTDNGILGAKLNIAQTEYEQPQDPTKKRLNLNDDRFDKLRMWLYVYNFASIDPRIVLIDTALKEAKILLNAVLSGAWIKREISVMVDDHNLWTVEGGFLWTAVQYVRISHGLDVDNDGTVTVDAELNIDGLKVVGRNWRIDPLIHPTHNPAVKDDTSIGLYGRTVYWHPDDNIKCFEHTQAAGQRILSVNKNPFKRVVAKKGAKTWANPAQHLTFSLPEYGISSEDWRITELQFDWTRDTKMLRSTFTIVPKLYGLPTSTARMDTRGGLLAELVR